MDKRIWEIDLARALAIVLMVVFHTVYDLREFLSVDVDYASGFWYWLGKASALLFIFVSGISSGLSTRILKRGVVTVTMGMVITAVTYVVLGDMYIRYGILHFLGTCMLIAPLLQRLPPGVLAVLATAIGLSARHVDAARVGTGLLLPLGVRYPGFASADYYPLIPYLAVFLLGIIAYKLYYRRRRSLFPFALESPVIAALSRNSLKIYLLHQPIIVGLIMVYKHLYR
ncbi:MAG: heparan-alpha-glucosaminide N-acetyltransferase [Bacillota bacterium]|jgi:uncharacterized membrane protein